MRKLFITFLCFAGVCGMSSCDFSGLFEYLDELEQQQNEDDVEGEDEGDDEGDDEGENEGGGGTEVSTTITRSEMNKLGYAIKVTFTEVDGYGNNDGYFVYTRKGDKYRWDSVSKESVYVYIYDSKAQTAYGYSLWIESDGSKSGGWESDVEYYRTAQTVNNLFNGWILDGSGLLQHYGFTKEEKQEKILDFPCDVWSGTYSKTDNQMYASTYGSMTDKLGNTGKFYVWNELTLRTVVNDKVQTECTAIVVGLDDAPFEKTENITWIK